MGKHTREEMNKMRDMELARVRRDMDREKQVGTMKRGPKGRPKKAKTQFSREELNKMRDEKMMSMRNKGVLRTGEGDKGMSNIGQINYITQQKTNIARADNGEVVVADNLPYKRRFVE
tara:strand:- start:1347 stop:1700 length:354 start_codon:yes stop_codon:yes gene_type:complete